VNPRTWVSESRYLCTTEAAKKIKSSFQGRGKSEVLTIYTMKAYEEVKAYILQFMTSGLDVVKTWCFLPRLLDRPRDTDAN
jgi:hypothetical protein